ncbi:MAG TPA: alanine racemase [Planctomycetota bacterium]|nr:alanine racemase [Planctomycetota bacterium]HRR79787.1 alanine racemase [Planctomycetota bacterium]HRT95817.1 alanine racemase [Planctomycetota bacterium]
MESYLTAEISAAALRHNLQMLRRRLAPGVKLCVAAKANAYGHGLQLVLDVLAEQADVLGVATPQEAVSLRHRGFRKPILLFFSACAYGEGAELRDALAQLVANDVWLTLTAPAEVRLVAEAARHVNARAAVHVKVDSGMGRSGVPAAQVPALAERVRAEPSLELAGLYTHFALADAADKAHTLEQLACFRRAIADCGLRMAGHRDPRAEIRNAKSPLLHAANSAALVDLPETHLEMVRPGIAVYGYQPSDEMHVRLPLQPCLRLTGRLMQVRPMPAGSRCGYGLRHTFERDSRVGLVPVGYADGYLRCLTNKTVMRVRGQLVPARGTISMDQTIVDLTDVPSAAVGDEVEIISPDPADPHSVENLARLAGTIPYEITCRLGDRVRRRLVESFASRRP